MKNTTNKKQLCHLLCMFDQGNETSLISKNESIALHDEADITMISYVLDFAKRGIDQIRVLSDDTDVLILLIF